jgi:hypothetical protein
MPAISQFRPFFIRGMGKTYCPLLTIAALTPVEHKYSAYEKECLAVVFGCEKHRTYLEHKEFELFTNNQALSWLLRHTKELGMIGHWVLRLAPFKFRVSHISGKANVVADCLTRQHEELQEEVSFSGLVLGNLPEAFQSIRNIRRRIPPVGPCIDKSWKANSPLEISNC